MEEETRTPVRPEPKENLQRQEDQGPAENKEERPGVAGVSDPGQGHGGDVSSTPVTKFEDHTDAMDAKSAGVSKRLRDSDGNGDGNGTSGLGEPPAKAATQRRPTTKLKSSVETERHKGAVSRLECP